MIEILTENELNAVLLHEYGHLTNNSSFYQLSNFIYSKIPIVHAFFDSVTFEDAEELSADNFAIQTQKTEEYLNGAKTKVEDYFRIKKMG